MNQVEGLPGRKVKNLDFGTLAKFKPLTVSAPRKREWPILVWVKSKQPLGQSVTSFQENRGPAVSESVINDCDFARAMGVSVGC